MSLHEHGVDFRRLREAVVSGHRQGEGYRKHRREAVKQYVGSRYEKGGAELEVPVNVIELAVSVYVRALAPRAPRVLVRTPTAALLPFASRLESGFNRLLMRIGFAQTLRRWVQEAFFSVGILKIGYNGALYADVVDLDDWTVDWSARRWEQAGFAGHLVRLPRADAKILFGEEKAALLKTIDGFQAITNMGEDRVQTIGAQDSARTRSWREEVEFYEVWLSRERLIVRMADGIDEPLSVEEFDGPATGPYVLLAFNNVPGNLMPLPPVALWMDNHLLINSIRRKLGRQAERLKQVYLAQGAKDEDAKRLLDAGDGELIRMDNPQSVVSQTFGGADATLLALMLQTYSLSKELAGNIDALGGLSPQSDTLGQDQMLRGAASVRLQDMHSQVLGALREAVLSMGWFLWHKDLGIKAEVPWGFEADFMGSGMPFELGGADQRDGGMDDYEFTIQPYSVEPQTPQQLSALLQRVWTQIVMPLAPMLQEQGMTPNLEGALRLLAKLENFDEIEQLVAFSGGREPQHTSSPDMVLKSPTSLREYRRTSVSGTAPRGREQAMVSTLLGANVQEKETAGMMGG